MHWNRWVRALENISISNINITNLFSVNRNLVARCTKDYSVLVAMFADYSVN